MRLKKEYYIVGGYVTSANDGDEHYISAAQLAHLYGVDPSACLVAGNWLRPDPCLPEGLLVLTPRSDGNYALPKPDVEWL